MGGGRELVTIDPTRDVKAPRKTGDGFHVWSETEITRFEGRWQLGTRERLAMDLLLYTGLRRGDVVQIGAQHVRRVTRPDGTESEVAVIKTAKTGEVVHITLLAPLIASIAAAKASDILGDMIYLSTSRGAPFVKESFGNWFREACKIAGVPGAAHGLRKAGATRAAENGATEAELDAMFGWRGRGMAAHYSKTAQRGKLAAGAAHKLLKEQPTNVKSLTLSKGEGARPKKKTKPKT